jgi:hypothetical protein
VGKPADPSTSWIVLGSRRCRPTEHDARPPRGHPASDSLALDGALPASGRSTFARGWHGEGESVAAFSACDRSVDSNPLTPLAAPGHQVAEATLFPDAWARSHRGTSMRPAFQSPRCLPPEKDRASLFRELPRSAASLASDGSRRTCSSMFENDRLDLSLPAFACWLEAACAPLASAEQCSREHDRGPPEHPDRRIAVGATAWLDRVTPIHGNHRNRLEVRGRGKPFLEHSPRRLLVTKTSPRPRPFRVPPVATAALSPCPKLRG